MSKLLTKLLKRAAQRDSKNQNAKANRPKSTLKSKLLTTIALLVAVGLGVADLTTYTSLRIFLLGKLDQQLISSLAPTAQVLFDAYNGIQSSRAISALVPSGSWGELISSNGSVFSVAFVQPGAHQSSPPKLGTGQKINLNSIPINRAFTVSATSGNGEKYRVLAEQTRYSNLIVVLALPENQLVATLARLAIVTAAVSFALLVTLIALGFYLIGLGLAPLDRMSETADKIAKGDFSQRITAESHDAEIDKLTNALNTMLTTIEASIEQREASESRLKRFVADASHELRTPLTSIRGYAELIDSGLIVDQNDMHTAAERITAESKRMAGLIEDLLLLARLDQSRELGKLAVNFSRVVEIAIQDARVVEPNRPITFELTPNLVVTGDPERLTQVVGNLFSNLRAHTAIDTPAFVHLTTITDTQPNSSKDSGTSNRLLLTVEDRGPGMTDEQLMHAFDRFYRAESSRARTQGGVGLGLSLVASIVHAHGGKVWIRSAGLGHGTTVGIELPLQPASSLDDDAKPNVANETSESQSSISNDSDSPASTLT